MNALRFVLALMIGLMTVPAAANPLTVIMSTSMEASGIGPYLRAAYRQDTGQEVRAIVTGSGQAFAAVRHGTVDLIMTHEPLGAQQLHDSGYITRPRPFMANHFILVGPADDPAKLATVQTLEEGFMQMRERRTGFVSRGDLSGTHRQETALWRLSGPVPKHQGYVKAGIGMAGALRMAAQLDAYTLTEPGSFMTAGRHLGFAIVIGGDENIENRYEVSLTKDADETAQHFADWLLGPLGQGHIAAFRIDGQHPYRPVRRPLQ